jgi:hypothetical protein
MAPAKRVGDDSFCILQHRWRHVDVDHTRLLGNVSIDFVFKLGSRMGGGFLRQPDLTRKVQAEKDRGCRHATMPLLFCGYCTTHDLECCRR